MPKYRREFLRLNRLIDRVRQPATLLVTRPLLAVAVLFAVTGAVRPYLGIRHDALLYAAQTMNRLEPDRWRSDLFFRYGSQDKFSAFSSLAAPVVSGCGLHAGFALLYLVGLLLVTVGVYRLVRRVVDDPLLAWLAMGATLITRVPFGGLETLHVVETMLTPRLYAVGFGLLAIEAGLRRTWLVAAAWLTLCGACNPLYAVGPALALFGLWGRHHLRFALPAVALAGVAGVVLLLEGTFAARLLGTMDPEWRGLVRAFAALNFTTEWTATDFARVAIAAAVHGVAIAFAPKVRALAACSLLVGVVALAGNLAVEALPYALPFQGQPYRSLWVPQFLAIPLAFATFAERRDSIAAVALAASLCVAHLGAVLVLPVALASVGWPLSSRTPRGLLGGFFLGFVIACGVQLKAVVANWVVVCDDADWPLRAAIVAETLGPPGRLTLLAAASLLVSCRRASLAVLVPLGLLPALVFGVGHHLAWVQRARPGVEDYHFAGAWIGGQAESPARPCVYWPLAEGEYLWFDMGVEPYVSSLQLMGAMFNRGTAVEGARRLELARPWELDAAALDEQKWAGPFVQRFHFGHAGHWPAVTPPREVPTPTREDLLRLVADPLIDWVVLRHDFPEFSPATNGSIFVYDAQRIRRAK